MCAGCGWTDASALTKTADRIVCYECGCQERSTATVEEHHHLGRRSDPATIPVPGNVHRSLSDRQVEWPDAVRSNPHRAPLLWLAAALLGLRDHLNWWVDWLTRIAAWFVALTEALQARFGDRWWETLGIGPVWGAAS